MLTPVLWKKWDNIRCLLYPVSCRSRRDEKPTAKCDEEFLKGNDMALDMEAIARLYKKCAGLYDLRANAYYLLGLREFTYRRMAVQALNLKTRRYRSGDRIQI